MAVSAPRLILYKNNRVSSAENPHPPVTYQPSESSLASPLHACDYMLRPWLLAFSFSLNLGVHVVQVSGTLQTSRTRFWRIQCDWICSRPKGRCRHRRFRPLHFPATYQHMEDRFCLGINTVVDAMLCLFPVSSFISLSMQRKLYLTSHLSSILPLHF